MKKTLLVLAILATSAVSQSSFATDNLDPNDKDVFTGISKIELDYGFLPAPGEGCMKPAIAKAVKECRLAGFTKCEYIANDIKERKKIFKKVRVRSCIAYIQGSNE